MRHTGATNPADAGFARDAHEADRLGNAVLQDVPADSGGFRKGCREPLQSLMESAAGSADIRRIAHAAVVDRLDRARLVSIGLQWRTGSGKRDLSPCTSLRAWRDQRRSAPEAGDDMA